MRKPFDRCKNRWIYRPAGILPSTSTAFREQDENLSSREIARQVEANIQPHVAQIVCKQWDDSRSFDSLVDSFEVDQTFGDPIPEKPVHINQKHFSEVKTKDKIKQLQQKHLWLETCNNISVTRVNLDVWRICNPATSETDLQFQHGKKSLLVIQIPLTLLTKPILKLSNLIDERTLSELMALVSNSISLIWLTNR